MIDSSVVNQTEGIPLPGLDGTNPLGFLAALGVLHVMNQSDPGSSARMSWTARESWHPLVYSHGLKRQDDIVEAILAYSSALDSPGTAPQQERLDYADMADVISVPPEIYAEALDRAFTFAETDRPLAVRREMLDFIAAYGSTFCLKNNGNIQQSAFSFANGQGGKKLLAAFRTIRSNLSRDHIIRSILRKWDYGDTTKGKGICVFRWDPEDRRLHAHMGTAPADTDTNTMLAANYLAFLGLSMLPSVPDTHGLLTTGFFRFAGEDAWIWPVWDVPAGPDTVRSLLSLPLLGETPVDMGQLRQMGIHALFRARRVSDDKGNVYFCPGIPA